MRRDYFEVDVRNVDDQDGDQRPVIAIGFDGPSGLLADRLVDDGDTLAAGEIDVAYRLTEDGDRSGVLAVTNRLTGDFVLEARVDAGQMRALVDAARRRGGEDTTEYSVRITDGDGKSTVYDKETLLVYDADGSLQRGESLIPGGVEL